MKKGVFVIAEAGVNHNGSLKLALKLVKAASDAGADAVKFQTFIAKDLVTASASKADYQKESDGVKDSQLQMLQRLELSSEMHDRLIQECRRLKIEFMTTAFEMESLKYIRRLGLQRYKIPSGEVTNAPFLMEYARLKKPLILSTGMCDLKEIREAIGVIAFGLLGKKLPSRKCFQKLGKKKSVLKRLKDSLTILHCTTEYPAPDTDLNLKALDTLSETFGLSIGYSDHSVGITAAVAAVGRGAAVIEKHLTLDRSMTGPDHAASIEPQEFKEMVDQIRRVEKMLGDAKKRAADSEVKNKVIARKVLVAAHDLKKGIRLKVHDISIKRAGRGISPMNFWNLIGKKLKKNYKQDEILK
ncbi:MAG: N-acetylneuraminate synthase [Verrucomicrobiota bacterium]